MNSAVICGQIEGGRFSDSLSRLRAFEMADVATGILDFSVTLTL